MARAVGKFPTRAVFPALTAFSFQSAIISARTAECTDTNHHPARKIHAIRFMVFLLLMRFDEDRQTWRNACASREPAPGRAFLKQIQKQIQRAEKYGSKLISNGVFKQTRGSIRKDTPPRWAKPSRASTNALLDIVAQRQP